MMKSNLGTRSTTFAVADVEPAARPLPQVSYEHAIAELLMAERLSTGELVATFEARRILYAPSKGFRPIYASARADGQLVADVSHHPLMAAVHSAFADHRPLRLSPDMVWLLICQGVAHHVNANAEALRSQFVQHQGQRTLKVSRGFNFDAATAGAWPGVVAEWSAQIRDHIGPKHDLFTASFSTTGPAEKTAFEIVLLDTVQKYFHYFLMQIICGIPSITLGGEPDDWQSIVNRVEGFAPLGLEWWLTPLRPILRNFLAAAQGDVDLEFWRSIYRIHRPERPCSSESATGWINLFFPYLNDKDGQPTQRNPLLSGERDVEEAVAPRERSRRGQSGALRQHERSAETERTARLRQLDYPTGLSRAPFTWELQDERGNVLGRSSMELLGGFVGIAQDAKSLCLRPEIGWAIREAAGAGREESTGAMRPTART